jgi:hypothetical protein
MAKSVLRIVAEAEAFFQHIMTSKRPRAMLSDLAMNMTRAASQSNEI